MTDTLNPTARPMLTYQAPAMRSGGERATVILRPFGYASSHVWENGRLVGTISGGGESGKWIGRPEGTHGTYYFPTREAAVDACRSYATFGYWHGEAR